MEGISHMSLKQNIGAFKGKIVVTTRRILQGMGLRLFKNRSEYDSNVKYNVSICAIFKNEASYLKEWIEWHKIVGIEHFYLYNNNSDDEYMCVLQKYIRMGLVTLIDWPMLQGQIPAYHNCIELYGKESKWLGFIDIDELIVPRNTDEVYSFLKKFENKAPAVAIHWRTFGASGRVDRDIRGLMAEDFVVCWDGYDPIGKCFLNMKYEIRLSDNESMCHHMVWARTKGIKVPPLDERGKIFWGIPKEEKKVEIKNIPIQINHYVVKSYNEFVTNKLKKGDPYFKVSPKSMEYFYHHNELCMSTDYSAYKYLIQLKLAMAEQDSENNS